MQLNGHSVKNDNRELVVIPRSNGHLAFYFQPVLMTEEEYTKLYPLPKAPMIRKPGKPPYPDYNDEEYKKKVLEHQKQRLAHNFLKSIAATPTLTWDTVDLEKPETWVNWDTELDAAGFTQSEKNLLFEGYMKANTLSDEHVAKATQDFLLSQAAMELANSSSQDTDDTNMSSGEPVNE